MQVKKAVITAAGRGSLLYPAADTVQKGMLPIVDLDGLVKPALQIIAEEALESGIEEVCVVCAPGDGDQYRRLFLRLRDNLVAAYKGVEWAERQARKIDRLLLHLHFSEQTQPLGYGHAVFCGRSFVGRDPFLLLLGDHLYISARKEQRCARQLLEMAHKEGCSLAAVQPTREHLVGRYGTLSGKCVPHNPGVYQIEKILEKPSLSQAEMELQTPGLRTGFYLCFFGMHVLTSTIFQILEEEGAAAGANGNSLPLTPSLQILAVRERFLAMEVAGTRYDLGERFGSAHAQIAMGLAGQQRDEFLSMVLESLAESNQRLYGDKNP